MLYRDEVPTHTPYPATRALGLGVFDAEVYDYGEVRAYMACLYCESGHLTIEKDGHLWARTIHADDCAFPIAVERLFGGMGEGGDE